MKLITYQLIIEKLQTGRWAICYPDCNRFDHKSYKTFAAAKRELTLMKKEI